MNLQSRRPRRPWEPQFQGRSCRTLVSSDSASELDKHGPEQDNQYFPAVVNIVELRLGTRWTTLHLPLTVLSLGSGHRTLHLSDSLRKSDQQLTSRGCYLQWFSRRSGVMCLRCRTGLSKSLSSDCSTHIFYTQGSCKTGNLNGKLQSKIFTVLHISL